MLEDNNNMYIEKTLEKYEYYANMYFVYMGRVELLKSIICGEPEFLKVENMKTIEHWETNAKIWEDRMFVTEDILMNCLNVSSVIVMRKKSEVRAKLEKEKKI